MKSAHALLEFLRDNPEFTAFFVWPAVAGVYNTLFGQRSTEEWDALRVKSAWRYEVARFMSEYGPDTSRVVSFVKRVTSRGK